MFQKLMILSVVLMTAALGHAERRAPWAHYELGFTPGRVTSESHLGMCDDSYYGGFTVWLPGLLNQDFTMKYGLDKDCAYLGSKTEIRKGKSGTLFFVEGQCTGTIEFNSIRVRANAVMEVSDAC